MNERNERYVYNDYSPMFKYFEELSKEELFPSSPIINNPFGDIYKRIIQLPVLLRKKIMESFNSKWSLVTFYRLMRNLEDTSEGWTLITPLTKEEHQLIADITIETLEVFIKYIKTTYSDQK